ncbi:S-layer homology domain-containing protein [Candidatus Peregrinibacteria bacterium]|nr:S-layer homology domain-containing protein [Candidatus Peregrinibacteria bacterium]
MFGLLAGLLLGVLFPVGPEALRTEGSHALTAAVVTPYVTRAEAAMALLLSRMTRVPQLKNDSRFIDIESGTWYEPFVMNAERYGILRADPLGRIRPNDPINRVELLKMLAHTYGLPENLPYIYTDVSPNDWYHRYAGIAREFLLFPGEKMFARLYPARMLTHAEVSRAIQQIFNKRGNNFPPLDQLAQTRRLLLSKATPYLTISHFEEEITMVQTPLAYQKVRSRQGSSSSAKTFTSPNTFFRELIASSQLAKMRTEMLTRVNAKRAAAKLPPLSANESLHRSAQQYAALMSRKNFFAHVSPEGLTFRQRIEGSGYYDPFFLSQCFCAQTYVLGENIARGQKTAEEVIQAWWDSPEHRKAMLHPDFTDLGIGFENGFWVQHFGGVREN